LGKTRSKRFHDHVYIPDTQIKPGVPTEHIAAAGRYIADKRPDRIIIAGDWWDFPSLSSYDGPTKKARDGVSVEADIEAGNASMREFCKPWEKIKGYSPDCHFTLGNHENRRVRYADEHPELADTVALKRLHFGPFRVHEFLRPVVLDGVAYCHYYAMDANGRVMRSKNGQSSARAQVNNVGMSATAGHRQGLDTYIKESPMQRRRGIIAGSFYRHDEEYLTPQGNSHWVGILHKFEVREGDYDLLEVSLNFLLRRYV
jgi:hypothetical protein